MTDTSVLNELEIEQPQAKPAAPEISALTVYRPLQEYAGAAFSPLESIRNHRTLAWRVTVACLVLGLPAAWFIGKPKYSASASVFVSPVFVANLSAQKELEQKSNYEYREYVQQNVRTIDRFDILLDALEHLGKKKSLWEKSKEDDSHAVERLQKALEIQAVPDTYQITVTLEEDHPQGLAEVVNSVVNTYLKKAKAEEFYASDERVKNLTQDRNRLQKEIEAKRARRVAITQALGIGTFSENYVNPYDQLLIDAKESLYDARTAQINSKAQLAAVSESERAGGAESLHAAALEMASKDQSLTSLLADQNLRRTQLLTSISGLSPDHPGRKAAERELANLDKARQESSEKLVDSYSDMLLQQRRADAYRTAQVAEKLEAEVAKQASQASWFSSNYQEGIQLGIDLESIGKHLDAIQERIDSISLESRAPGFVRMFSSARPPDSPSKNRRSKLMALCVVGSLLLGMFVPIGVDTLDPRVHSLRDVERTIGFSPLGWLLDKEEAGPQFAREQVFRLANRLSQDQQGNRSRVFAFTSVKARGGVSSIVSDTARALTRLGVSTLVVEANAYRADPRYRSPDFRGLTILLQSKQSIEDAIVYGGADMPDVIPVGDVQNEQSLPDLQNLLEILRQAAENYQMVLVDIPPILVSADAEFIAHGSDVVVLVIEAESVSKNELQRAGKSLEMLRAPAVSAILNRVQGAAANGFGKRALEEFRTGTTKESSPWLSPWLWK